MKSNQNLKIKIIHIWGRCTTVIHLIKLGFYLFPFLHSLSLMPDLFHLHIRRIHAYTHPNISPPSPHTLHKTMLSHTLLFRQEKKRKRKRKRKRAVFHLLTEGSFPSWELVARRGEATGSIVVVGSMFWDKQTDWLHTWSLLRVVAENCNNRSFNPTPNLHEVALLFLCEIGKYIYIYIVGSTVCLLQESPLDPLEVRKNSFGAEESAYGIEKLARKKKRKNFMLSRLLTNLTMSHWQLPRTSAQN